MNVWRRLSGPRRALALAGAGALVAGGLVTIPVTAAQAATQCDIAYTSNEWPGGFTASVTIKNVGDPLNGWTLGWTFPNSGQRVQQGWSATFTQSGSQVTARSLSYNGTLATGASTSIGFNGAWSGSNPKPTSFTLNGVVCNGGTTPPTTPPPTDPPPTTPPPTDPPPTTPPPGTKVDNPYAGVRGYVNPEWKAKADAETGGSRVSNNPTAVWLDRIAAINGTPDSSSNGAFGVRQHLDEALRQGAGYIQFVIYNLPGRDCSALASNGELGPDELPKYKAQYIDPIAAIQGESKYSSLRIINIIEIDSLPNLVTNTSDQAGGTVMCDTVKANGAYVNGVGYALAKLGAIGNVYNYIDAGHHGWLGWDSNFVPTSNILKTAAVASGSTVNNVHGFITNTANYSALTEPYFKVTDNVNGQTVRQSKWVDWNFYVDELSFAQAFRNQLVSVGFNSNIGMLIDTSRNGWGGSARPTGPGATTSVDTYVNGGRIDRRAHLGNWCNQAGAGLGERPRANPATGIDAYVWVKPPGESDGSSKEIPNNEGKGFDRMCDPTYGGNARNGNNPSGALANAPISGAWFSAQFQELMRNAYPAL
ncbi:glycoside hydrolase family 6 protein [Micromonospora saelicesensis]|uniref:Glucanase n=1 Tax=Micromonospora saelicesensis TaxID=285676 RepID=A0A1C4ZGY7_9ACTN|nr:glycoside hydrolase family 6 protein [Micromonospora saelicesensis]RAO01040.1 Cellulase [Micromonospora saelicesensis]RAO40925.1 Cellulase [Micromonospora saelicesensis]RAO52100.1 Cellulase [Micromonospora saelicesensis]RAO60264.1 Cellulase [Micromonospora saelicesensis]SCF32262.1 Cellulase/cellobiase CelA1 [Micromonospora saelicesensis]